MVRRATLFLETLALICILWLFSQPSGSDSAVLFGYSGYRLALGAFLFAAAMFCLYFYWKFLQSDGLLEKLNAWLQPKQNGKASFWLAMLAIGVLGWALLFTWLFFPASLRPVLTWLLALAFVTAWVTRHWRGVVRELCPLPRLSSLMPAQRLTLTVMLVIILVVFVAYGFVNWRGADDYEAFFRQSSDEAVMYPILMDSMKPGDDLRATLYHIFIYEDYHYGYPFYALSQLVLLPVKWLTGDGFERNLQVNMLLLRQVTSVLPLLLAALVVVYLADRLRSFWRSVLLLILLLTMSGMDGYNRQFWHPDGLNALFIVLVIFFLRRDALRFGCNFYLAALFCGLSISTRVYGAFFVLSVGGYLLYGVFTRRVTLRQGFGRGLLFVALMLLVVFLSSPYLFEAGARTKLAAIFDEKKVEMAIGYAEPDVDNIYRTGWEVWLPFFDTQFTANWFSAFLVLSILSGIFLSREKVYYDVLLGWVIMLGGYLVYFVAVKSSQYMIPLFLPFAGGVYGIYDSLIVRKPVNRGLVNLAEGTILALMLAQIWVNVSRLLPLIR